MSYYQPPHHFLSHTQSLYHTLLSSLQHSIDKISQTRAQRQLQLSVRGCLNESFGEMRERREEVLWSFRVQDEEEPSLHQDSAANLTSESRAAEVVSKENSAQNTSRPTGTETDSSTAADSMRDNQTAQFQQQEKQNSTLNHQNQTSSSSSDTVTQSTNEQPDVLDHSLKHIMNKMHLNMHNLPNALLVEVQHGEVSMPLDDWIRMMHESLKSRNHDPNDYFIDDSAQSTAKSTHMKDDTSTPSKSMKKSSRRAQKGSLGLRISSDLKPNETIHNYIVRNSSHRPYRKLSYSSLDFLTEFYHSILVIIDSRTVPMEKIVQWLRVARKFHHRFLMCTVIEMKRHDMFINMLPNDLVPDFHFTLYKKSPSKREVIFSLMDTFFLRSNPSIPFRLTHELFENLLDSCTIRNDDVHFFSTFMISVMETMISTQRLSFIMYYAKKFHTDTGFTDSFRSVLKAIPLDDWLTLKHLPSVEHNEELLTLLQTPQDNEKLFRLVEVYLHRLFFCEELNFFILDCCLAVWRAVRRHTLLFQSDMKAAQFRYITQRIVLYKDFLKCGSFQKTKMMRAAIRQITDSGMTYSQYTKLLDAFDVIFEHHFEKRDEMQDEEEEEEDPESLPEAATQKRNPQGWQQVKENITLTKINLTKEFESRRLDAMRLKQEMQKNSAEVSLKDNELDNTPFPSQVMEEFLTQMICGGLVNHYSELPLWELYYVDSIESQKNPQVTSHQLQETLTSEDWMNSTTSYFHRMQLLYAHHSDQTAFCDVFRSMRLGGNTENTQYEEYLNETDQEDSVELQRQWYKWMKTIKTSGLRP